MKFLILLFCFGLFGASLAGPAQLEATDCTICELLVDVLDSALNDAMVDNCVENVVLIICEKLKIDNADDHVCNSIVSEFGDELIYVIKNLLKENPQNLCGFLIKDCDYKFNPFDIRWPLPLPGIKPKHEEAPLPTGNKTLKVLHLSDLHIDMQYQIGSEANCTEPQCCRAPNNNHEFVQETDTITVPAQKWGTIGNCDLPYWTAEDMLQHINATHSDIDYVVVSGDLESHAIWTYTSDSHAQMIKNVSDLLRKYFPTTNVYFAIGNHEGVPIDSIAPHWVPENLTYKLYDTMADSWHGWVPDDQEAVVRYRGCYMVKVYPGLRLISLNNLYGDPYNLFLLLNQTDPDGTMSWLSEQLAIAEYAGDKVQIVAHIPGSASEAYEGWAINYYNLVNRFEDTIVAQFFGHTHSEQYYMYYLDPEDATSRPTSVIFSAPSVTTYSQYNPAYRIYTIDGNYPGSSFQILDFQEWYLNLTAHGNASTTTWDPLYTSVKEVYGMKNLSAGEWNNLAERMKTNETLVQTYIRNYFRRDDAERPDLTCDTKCTNDYICHIRKAHHSDNLCKDLNITKEIQQPSLYRRPINTVLPKISTREEALALIRKIQQEQKAKGKDAGDCEI
uniref:Sphingomyelin phosphodiesterase n=1 Tax=Acrobeloides nanus TaxID=290746 RepID=A0A914DSH6_9BILA